MLAKLTSKNQLTLPKAAVVAVGAAEYFDVEVRKGQIVLTPVRIQRIDAIRAKLDQLGIGDREIAEAVEWARSGAANVAAEPSPPYASPAPRKPAATKKSSRRK